MKTNGIVSREPIEVMLYTNPNHPYAATKARTKQWAMRPLPPGLAGRIRGLRQRRKWTQDQLAREAKVSRNTVRNVERGKMPSVTTLTALAKALGASVDALLKDRKAGAT